MPTIYLNGSFVQADNARVSAFDAGFQHGVGLFETILAFAQPPKPEHLDDGHAAPGINAWAIGLERHIERLIASAAELGLANHLRKGPLAEAVLRVAEASALPRARIRLTLTGGDLNLLASRPPQAPSQPPPIDPTILIVAQPATVYPDAFFERGVTVVLADLKTNPLDPTASHKTLNYWARLRELRRAADHAAGEALVFQVTNHLAGGCVSNAFLVKDGVLHTPIARGEEQLIASASARKGPAMPSPVLPGVTRAWLIDWAATRRIDVRTRMITIDDVLAADEILLTNSSWGVLPVVAVEKHQVGRGDVGELTRDAIAAWRRATA